MVIGPTFSFRFLDAPYFAIVLMAASPSSPLITTSTSITRPPEAGAHLLTIPPEMGLCLSLNLVGWPGEKAQIKSVPCVPAASPELWLLPKEN